jgi:1,5-anhydro-D-fructose reductase (1,5-anhydro-D-mannitol-forming)
MVNWLVIGVGDITSKRVIPAIQEEPRSRLYGILTRNPRKAETYGTKVFTELEDALGDPDIHAVYVASPVFLHHPQTIAALKAGKHVLCEKPTALNFGQACDMQATAEREKRVYGVAYYRRLYPKILRTRDLLVTGEIGRPLICEAHNHYWFAPQDGFRAWLLDPEKAGGGPLFDIACHRIDLFNFFFGKPLSVTAQMSNAVQRDWRVEDNATVMIEYSNHVRCMVDVRWHSKVPRDDMRIIGVNGQIELSPVNSPLLLHTGVREDLPSHKNLHYPCIENFVNAVLEGSALASSGKTAMVTDWVTEQAVASARNQQPATAKCPDV